MTSSGTSSEAWNHFRKTQKGSRREISERSGKRNAEGKEGIFKIGSQFFLRYTLIVSLIDDEFRDIYGLEKTGQRPRSVFLKKFILILLLLLRLNQLIFDFLFWKNGRGMKCKSHLLQFNVTTLKI
jgi:hypothetical protein